MFFRPVVLNDASIIIYKPISTVGCSKVAGQSRGIGCTNFFMKISLSPPLGDIIGDPI
jgi:hypothetical protein